MTRESRPGRGTGAAEAIAGSTTGTSVPRPADMARYRRRRACRQAYAHLGAYGLLSELVVAELARIEQGAAS